MGRPRAHDDATAVALLDAAESLLASGGPAAVTVRAVAEAHGTTTRAVYSLFGGKAGLLEQLAGRGYQLLTRLVSGLPETDDAAADLVAAGVHGFRRFAEDKPHLFRLTFEDVTAQTVSDQAVAASARESYLALARWITRAREGGAIDSRPRAEVVIPPRTRAHARERGISEAELARIPSASGKLMPADVDAWIARSGAPVAPSARDEPLSPDQRRLVFRMRRSTERVIPGTIAVDVPLND